MVIHWEKTVPLGTGRLDEVKGEVFSCQLIYWIILFFMQTTCIGNQACARGETCGMQSLPFWWERGMKCSGSVGVRGRKAQVAGVNIFRGNAVLTNALKTFK